MRKTLIIIILLLMPLFVFSQKTEYGIWATCTINIETGEIISPVTQYFEEAILEEHKLLFGDKVFFLHNYKEKSEGFNTYKEYDAIDNNNNRCKIYIQNMPTAEEAVRNVIYIKYEGVDYTNMFLSRKPKKIK